ncbi:hypothetical protein [Mucilaginibacter frigoritolerans]|uniref:hypothetical protein n=1 Tax=Mucilaginibacter frigoritolerans TaxID=652788 RepID=UPI0014776B87|nr:hypothetical protein [Mucilaginibacter frigoritolerans]
MFFGQMLLDVSPANIISNLFALTAFISGCIIVFSYRNISIGAALSATVVFLMISANSIAPMVGTLLEGNPIIESLVVPVQTFEHRLIFAFCILFAHYLSCSESSLYIRKGVSSLSRKLKSKITLPSKSLWIIGLIGLFAILLKTLHPPIIVSKLLDGFAYLMMAPFLMLLPPYYNRFFIKKQRIWLFLFYLVQVVFSFVYNTRIAMVQPIGIVVAGWLLTVLSGQTIVTQKSIKTGLIRGVIGIAVIGQFSDLSTAILIERGARENRTSSEQFKATVDRFFDKRAIADYKDQQVELTKGVSAEQEWQENYVRNPFLARFIQIKFDDNCLYRVGLFNNGDFDKLRAFTFDRIMVQLPQPVLSLFSIKVDKIKVSSHSVGDEIDNLATGAEVGGFKTGSIPTNAFALFSWWYPLFLALNYYLIFSIYHGFFSPFYLKSTSNIKVPTLALLLTFTIYFDISLDGVDALEGSLIRGIIQRVLIYAITLWILRKLRSPIDMFKARELDNKGELQLKNFK